MNTRSVSLTDTSSPLGAELDLSADTSVVSAPAFRIRLWDLPVRVFHWSLVAAVTVAVVTGEIGGDWMKVHGIAGLFIVGLVVFRVVWGVIGSTHARFTQFFPTPKKVWAHLKGRWQGTGHNPLGALSVLALLGLLAVQVGTGLFSNDDIAFTGPLAVLVSDTLSLQLTGWHHQLSTLLFVIMGLHVLAILFYLVFKRDNLVKPMVTGYKQVKAGSSTRKGGWIAFAVAVAIGAAAVYVASGAALPAPAPAPKAAPQASPAW